MGDHGPIRDARNGHDDTIEPAVNQLIRRFIDGDSRPAAADEVDQIILDIEVGGARYLVIRCTTQTGPGADRARAVAPAQARPERGPALSPRESEIARLVAKGYANKTIASLLDISSWTVSSHLRRIYTKLGVGSRAAMVAQLLEQERGPSPAVERRSLITAVGR
jgi:DNA-binding CsgD family transcriptional regulator